MNHNVLVIALVAAAISGCLHDDPPENAISAPDKDPSPPVEANQTTPPPVAPAPPTNVPDGVPEDFHFHEQFAGCEHYQILFQVPLADLQAALPEGFTATTSEGAAAQYFLNQRGDMVAVGPLGIANLLIHPCGHHGDALDRPILMTHIFIDEPTIESGLPPVDHHFYALDVFAGGPAGPLLDAIFDREARSLSMESDGVTSDGAMFSGRATASLGGTVVAEVDVDTSQGNPDFLSGTFYVWNVHENGIYVHSTGYIEESGSGYFTSNADCAFDGRLELASVLGVTTCADAAAAGMAPTGVLATSHAHSTGIEYIWDKGWTGGAINVVPLADPPTEW